MQCCGSVTVWVWIRTRGSLPLTYGSGSGSCFLRQWLTRYQLKKVSFLLIYQSSKWKSKKRSPQNSNIKVFLTFLLVDDFYGKVCWAFYELFVLWVGSSGGGGGGERGLLSPLSCLSAVGEGEGGDNYAFKGEEETIWKRSLNTWRLPSNFYWNCNFSLSSFRFAFIVFAFWSVSLACEQSEEKIFFLCQSEKKLLNFRLVSL